MQLGEVQALDQRSRVEVHGPSQVHARLVPLAEAPLDEATGPGQVAVAGIARLGRPEFLQRPLVVELAPVVDLPEREMRLGQVGLELEGRVGGAPCQGQPRVGPVREVELPDVAPGQPGECQREGGIQLRGPGVHVLRRAEPGGVPWPVEVLVAAEVEIVGAEVPGGRGAEGRVVRRLKREVQRARDLLRDPGLHLEDLLQALVVLPRPEMAVVGHPDELRGDPHATDLPGRLLPPHAAFEDVVDAELPADLLERLLAAPVLVGAGAGDHAEVGQPREAAGDLLGDAVGEVAVLGRAQILERQDGDGLAPPAACSPRFARPKASAERRRDQRRRRERPGAASGAGKAGVARAGERSLRFERGSELRRRRVAFGGLLGQRLARALARRGPARRGVAGAAEAAVRRPAGS